MNNSLAQVKEDVYDKCGLEMTDFYSESESKEYDACRFQLNGGHVISRIAKITPKKNGQFVTFWKRKEHGPIEPFDDKDRIDFFVVNVITENQFGQFVFPKSVLVNKGILSTDEKEGKRAFRVYPNWVEPISNQAKQTQKWQLDYFFEITREIEFKAVLDLYRV